MPTPEQMANAHPQNADLERWLSDPATPVRDLQKYIHLIAYKNYPMDRVFPLARIALNVRIADEAEKASNKLSLQTDELGRSVAGLVTVAEDQKKLAEKLDVQTEKLINLTEKVVTLTRVLVALTVALSVVAVVQTLIMVKELNEKAPTSTHQIEHSKTQ